MKVTRRQSREWAIQMLTAADLNPPEDRQLFFDSFWQQNASVAGEGGGSESPVEGKPREFAEERVAGVLDHRDELDALLKGLLADWDLSRLGAVERAVLRMGAWELKYSDVPHPVVVNEAVDLANWFSTPRSRSLVNGVLDRLAKSCW